MKTPNDAKPLPAALVHQLCALVILTSVKRQSYPLYLLADAGWYLAGGGPRRQSLILTYTSTLDIVATVEQQSASTSARALLRPLSRLAVFLSSTSAL